jgi:hypothetical protein
MPDVENGRVTLAVLSTKLDNVSAQLADMITLFRQHCTDNETDSDRITRLEGRVNAWAAFQGTFTAIAATIAGWLGTRR